MMRTLVLINKGWWVVDDLADKLGFAARGAKESYDVSSTRDQLFLVRRQWPFCFVRGGKSFKGVKIGDRRDSQLQLLSIAERDRPPFDARDELLSYGTRYP